MREKTKVPCGSVELVKECLVCDKELILIAKRDTTTDSWPERGQYLSPICEECMKKYDIGGENVFLFDETGGMAVMKLEAFKDNFTCEKSPSGIYQTDPEIVNMIVEAHNRVKEEG